MKNLILLFITLMFFSACSNKTQGPSINLNPTILLKNNNITRSGIINKGQGLFQALQGIEISNDLALSIINSLRDEVEFSKLKVGDKVEATFNENKELISFSFSQNPAQFHIVDWDSNSKKWIYRFDEKETVWEKRIVSGELKKNSTLQQDLLNQTLSPSVVNEIINILMCKVNFRRNARLGDTYEILLNEKKFKNEVIETKIFYTSYNGPQAGSHESFYYEDEEKKSTYSAHYTKDGVALVKSALRYPLSSLHIRSGYGYRRHPVTGKRKMHRGVDLRGKVGRPVHAVADGVVVESTFSSAGGNKIAIRHRDGSTSYYLHLHNRSVNKGDSVKSYQIIGAVGATGRVTGPHLHFGFKKPNGKWMNPLNKRMIATNKLNGDKLNSLKRQIKNILGLVAQVRTNQKIPFLTAKSKSKEINIDKIWPL